MKRKAYGRDAGLTLRMLLTSSLLGLLYVAFALVLFYVFNAGLVLMVVIVGGMAIFQYFTSDKLALAASGAKIVSPEEAPKLHALIKHDLPAPTPQFRRYAWRVFQRALDPLARPRPLPTQRPR